MKNAKAMKSLLLFTLLSRFIASDGAASSERLSSFVCANQVFQKDNGSKALLFHSYCMPWASVKEA
jgi:hypothetical protein